MTKLGIQRNKKGEEDEEGVKFKCIIKSLRIDVIYCRNRKHTRGWVKDNFIVNKKRHWHAWIHSG